jgi:RsiW-degrading membrane proteinase PrsW (M82 family)
MSRFDWLFVLSFLMFIGSWIVVMFAAKHRNALAAGFGVAVVIGAFITTMLSASAEAVATGHSKYELRESPDGSRQWEFVQVKK